MTAFVYRSWVDVCPTHKECLYTVRGCVACANEACGFWPTNAANVEPPL